MTVTLLCLVVAVTGIALCLILAEPWQRPRYEQLAAEAKKRTQAALARLEEIDEFDAIVAADLHREANGQ